MNELLLKINETFDNCMANSSEETNLQLRILKNNINALFKEYDTNSNVAIKPVEPINEGTEVIPVISTLDTSESNKSKMFVIDDSSIVRNYLEKLFAPDYDVILCSDGQEAINRLSDDTFAQSINLIVLDLMMPNIDGFGVLEYLSGKSLKIPVIVISGDNSKDTINRAFEYNVVDVIEKPFDAKKIKDKIAQYVER